MAYYANDVHPVPPDHGASDCDDQLPLISRVGRGLKGDSARVRVVDPDTCTETYLEGGYWDEAAKEFKTEWISENINGGELSYQYNLRPYTIPRTFTITFIYRRPHRCEWSWTSPAMPYIWTLDPAGEPDEDPDHVVGSGVATLFIRTMHTDWDERLHYPEGTTRDDFNAPLPKEGWSATITFGHGGDVEVPDFDDLAKIIGVAKEDIFDILEDNSVIINGIEADNLIDYIDECDKRDRDHLHGDLGFGAGSLKGDGGGQTIKDYIDRNIDNVSVVSTNSMLTVKTETKAHGDQSGYGIVHKLTPKLIIAGPGIQMVDQNGAITISNSQVVGVYETLQAGRDFEFSWHNGWYMGAEVTHDKSTGAHPTTKPSTPEPPSVKAIVNRNQSDKIISAQITITCSNSSNETYLENVHDLLSKDGNGQLDKFMFRHSSSVAEAPLSAILSFKFIGDYAFLNNLSVLEGNKSLGIWNVRGTNEPITSSSATWHVCGASWQVNGSLSRNVAGFSNPFVLSAVNIADGYNGQYTTPDYGYEHLCIYGWANLSMITTLG